MVLERVISLIVSQFCVEEDQVDEDTSFKSLEADQQYFEDFVRAVEDEFDIVFNDDEVYKLNCVADVVEIVEKAIRNL